MTAPLPTLDDLVNRAAEDPGFGPPHARMKAAAAIAGRLEALAGDLVRAHVDRARALGHSWTDVAIGLGISRQAARQRFAPGARGATQTSVGERSASATRSPQDRRDLQIFHLLTPAGRRILDLASAEASLIEGRTNVEPEDLLMGLLRAEGSRPAEVLDSLGLDEATVRARLRDHRLGRRLQPR